MSNLTVPCASCSWRKSNQGKPHKFGWFTRKNLTRLWNQIRGGGEAQSCHLTDTSVEQHVACGAKGDKPKECAGSVVIVLRELLVIKEMARGEPIEPEHVDEYLRTRKKGLKKTGLLYWLVSRISAAGIPYIGGAPLPEVDADDPEVGLPKYLGGC